MRRARCAAGRRPATSLVAAGVDVKTAQTVLGHTDARVTLDLYAQVVTEQQQAAADAMAARFLDPTDPYALETLTGWSGFHVMVAGWTLMPTPAPRRSPR